tara:strand:+ start:263 stop:526 length:264 start_codon:yes stop_codon:yes gene_type:complete
MNTFFFGYLSLKWRRLMRFVISPIILFLLMALNEEIISEGYTDWVFSRDDFYAFSEIIGLAILFVFALIQLGFISWIIKPFIVKDKT